jgi:hypothetical protein
MKQGFSDANGRTVSIGDLVEHVDRRYAEVLDLTQDGDVTIKCLDGDQFTTKWGRVAKLPKKLVKEIRG